VISNLPAIDWQLKPGSLPGLVLVSSNFVQENISGSVFQHWYAEVRNDGGAIICLPQIAVELQDSSGTLLVQVGGFADAAPYSTVGGSSTPCLAAGATGAAYWIARADRELSLAQIRRATWSFTGLERPTATPHRAAPVITGSVLERITGYWVVDGSLRATGGDIHNVKVEVYPEGASGWLVDNLTAINLGAIYSGSAWSFQTTSYQGPRFSSYQQFASFLDGAALAPGDAAIDSALTTAAARHRDAHGKRNRLRAERDAARAALR
jgi:hypothetical protein